MIVPQSSSASAIAVERVYYPLHSVRCAGIASFRSQSVRDYACILDFDDDVQSWRCRPVLDGPDDFSYQADFLVRRTASVDIVDIMTAERPVPRWVQDAILESGYGYSLIDPGDYPATRLQNAKDLLRYARYDVPLAERVRLLASLDDLGSLTVAECLASIQASQPIAAVARLVLQRFIEIDLDEALIGPETTIRRRRD